VPATWTGLGELLAGAGERAPADALTLAAVASGNSDTSARPPIDLSEIWALPPDMAAARTNNVTRALDAKAGCSCRSTPTVQPSSRPSGTAHWSPPQCLPDRVTW
jgi:hypothetical protein